MKGNKLFLSNDYRSLYESSCGCLRNSIINAIGEIFIITALDAFYINVSNYIKIGDDIVVGVCVKKNFLHLIVHHGKKKRFVKVYEKQKDKTFLAFDSNICNWIDFIERIQEEINKGVE